MIKIAFTGDIMLARNVGQTIEKNPNKKIIETPIGEFLREFDFVVGNLECPVSSSAVKKEKTSFRAHPDTLTQIENFHLLSLANNHIFDCGKQGALDTVKHLKQYTRDFCGLLEDANASLFKKVSITGKEFAFYSCAAEYCIRDSEYDFYPKIISAADPAVIESIQSTSQLCDYTIVLVHGGNELVPYPEQHFRNLCQNFIDAGADAVVTHHPHVTGGVHVYRNKYIFYSLGDFIFDGESFLRRQGVLLHLSFDENHISYMLHPTEINSALNVGFASDRNARATKKRWAKTSSTLQNDSKYDNKYRYRYTRDLLIFQIDRLSYLLKNKGGVYMFKFMLNKIQLAPHYFRKIFSKDI
ncbi:MAG TPA: CapA family protein [Agriterribacter sp.]|nr:CapA family protein [Chitinophagaceae bacterium]HRP31786.1 CapA family protein [Agriterribacter sp.]